MFKRPVIIPAMILLCFFLPTTLVVAQSQQQGLRIFNEGLALQQRAQSNEDLKRAVRMYEQALTMFSKMGDARNEGAALNNLGALYSDWGQYDKAADYYEKCLEIKKKVGDLREEGQTLGNLGTVYWHWGQLAKAVDYYEKSLEIAKNVGDVKAEANALKGLGNVYNNWGQYDKAVDHYEKSLAICRELKDRRGEGQTLMCLGVVFKAWGQYDKAVDYYEKSFEIASKIGDVKGEGMALMNLGNVYSGWGQYAKAKDYFEKSFEIARKIGDVHGEGTALMNLGIVYADWGQYAKAVEFYEKDLAICRKIGDVQGEGTTLTNLGSAYGSWGQYAKAKDYFEKSLEIFRKIGNLEVEGTTLTNLGSVYADWGQYAKAAEFYEKSFEIARKIGDVKGEGIALMALGSVYADWGQYAKAVEFYEKSLETARKIGDAAGEGLTLTNLGEVYRAQGEHDKAMASFQKGLEICVKIGVPADRPRDSIGNLYLDKGDTGKAEPFIRQANYNSSLGRLSLVKADYPSARKYYESLRKAAEENRKADNLFTAYTGLGMAHEGTNDNTKAVEYFRNAVALTEDLRSSLNPAERETFFDVRIGGFYRTAPYEGLARVLLKLNKPTEAFKESEYTRARIFAESISKRSEYAGADVPKNIRDKDSQLTDELAALTKNLQKGYEKENKEVIASLEPQVKQAKETLAAHVDILRKQYPLFAATRYPQPMDLDKTGLQDNEWVLAYHVTDPGIIIYLTRGKTLVKGLFKPIPRKEVDELVRKFRDPLEMTEGGITKQQLAKFDFGSGKKLSDLLLADILSDLPKNTPVIIIPDGSLGVVPFEMLVLNEGGRVQTDKKVAYVTGAEFLGDRNPISYYQSVTAITLARTLGKQQKGGDRTLAMVDPVFSPDDARLVKAAAEKKHAMLDKLTAEKLMSFKSELSLDIPRLPLTTQLGESLKKADPEKTDLYEGLKAQKALLLKNDLKPYRSLVFGTHGYFGKDLPGIQEPVLILTLPDQPEGQDGFLRLSEVMGLKINCDIAALSACQTGLGRHISGEGTMGMGRAFQYAGAKSVLMSLWSVSETSSVQLVESFFRHLKEGKNKLEALKEARDEIRKAGYDHPFYWAPFILVGEVK